MQRSGSGEALHRAAPYIRSDLCSRTIHLKQHSEQGGAIALSLFRPSARFGCIPFVLQRVRKYICIFETPVFPVNERLAFNGPMRH